MLAFIRYSTLRFAVLLAVGAVGYLLGLRDLPLLLVAFVGSGAISLFLLDRQRDALGSSVGGVFTRLNQRIDASARAEDVEEDVQEGEAK